MEGVKSVVSRQNVSCTSLGAMDAACDDITAEIVQDCYGQKIFPLLLHNITSENIRCGVNKKICGQTDIQRGGLFSLAFSYYIVLCRFPVCCGIRQLLHINQLQEMSQSN